MVPAVRPLLDDGASKAEEATRDYVLKVDGADNEPRLINIFGGKITTYRRLAESALDEVDKAFDRKTRKWTGTEALPGGDFPVDGFDQQVARLAAAYPYLDAATARRLVGSYGTVAHDILGEAQGPDDLGQMFAAGLSEREAVYLRTAEWARTADDILWRRSKLGLRFNAPSRQRLDDWFAAQPEVEAAEVA